MKRLLVFMVIALAVTASTPAGDWEDVVYGGIWGGLLGGLIGEIDGDIDSEVAIPAGIALGALFSVARSDYEERAWNDPHGDRRYWGPYRDHPRYHTRYYPNAYWYGHPIPYTRIRTAPVTKQKSSLPPPVPKAPDYHPGVKIVLVPVTFKNGMTFDLRILQLHDRFVGPQGESYAALPTSELLAQRYAP